MLAIQQIFIQSSKRIQAEICRDFYNFLSFSLRKKLLNLKLIECQQFYQAKQSEGSVICQLLHLPRFYTSFKPRYVSMTDKIIEFLKEQPNYAATYDQLRGIFGENANLKYLTKHAVFSKHIKVEYVSGIYRQFGLHFHLFFLL